ncbi:Protein RETICULATA-RELATED 5, chloroplastic [Dichanthelium oligosanthes]|uniref:Protein RETICULATA-RELATED 5, chloroplastic n=1 Tax=Dichanthelium oligosanthes TaxID=888268 RepID=A0A1E5UYD4_9POAL|nr:Protein RETICULATA-RELATED 5, chloroplastic [Dichanthelium oligosanthes]
MMAAEPSPSSAASAAADDLETLALDSSSSSAAATASASTDPLLRPPPSQTAAANHDAFVIDDDFLDDEDDLSPAPSPIVARPPAARADAAAPVFAKITVSDPKKHAEPSGGGAAGGVIPGSGSYFTYLITTHLAGGAGEVVRVRRRFRDVVALADRLAAAYRGLFVPARPDKSVLEGQVMQRHDFVSQRCAALQRYLCRLATHPVVGCSPDLRTFLTEPGAIPAFQGGEAPRYWTTTVNAAAPLVPAKAGRDLFGMFKGLKQTVVNGLVATKPPPVEQETDTEFLAHKARFEDLQQQLTTTSQQAEALVKAQDDLRETTGHLGMTLIKLAKFEREQATCNSLKRRAGEIHNFANFVLKMSRSQIKLNSEIVKHLGSIHEYLEAMISVHHAFTDRANALHHVQSLSADLYSLHTRAGRLESSSARDMGHEWSTYQKVEGLKETIRLAEAAKSDTLREYESIKVPLWLLLKFETILPLSMQENNKIEIKRFDKERRRDFIEMLKGFVVNQVSYSDNFANVWTKVSVFHTLLDAGRAGRRSLWLSSFLIHTHPSQFAWHHLSRISILSVEHTLAKLRSARRAPGRPGAMLSRAPSQSPAASFKPFLSSPRSRLGASCKPLTATTASSSASTRRSVCACAASRRGFLLLAPSLAAASAVLRTLPSAAAESDDADPPSTPAPPTDELPSPSPRPTAEAEAEAVAEVEAQPEPDESAMSRVYDATVLGEPEALAGDARGKVWEKLAAARVVYLGEAELEPDPDDRALELEIVRGLAGRFADAGRGLALALEAFPCDLQQQLDQFMDGRIDGRILKLYTSHWPQELWQQYEPLLNYCRDNGIKLVACGTPLEVKRTVQADGIRALTKAEREAYAPPVGSGFISNFMFSSGRSLIDKISSMDDSLFGPTSYLSEQARVVDDYTISQIIMKELNHGGLSRLLIVVTGASHVMYGPRGSGVPGRISKKVPKKDQVVVLLDPERQVIRREGEVPIADFLWYSAAKPCTRNCFDRAEIARVMNAAGRRPEALPQDLQKGIDLGVVSPEILQNFFDLEKYPVMAELIHRFQGFRERLLADPKFLQRLAIEEAISITTTLLAQYERRKERFFEEIDYVLTDTIRGSVVDFFTVWLPAPTISVLQYADDGSGQSLEFVKGLLGSLPDNAFQKNVLGQDWSIKQRIAAVLVGGLKLASVGFISSVGAGVSSDLVYAARGIVKPSENVEVGRKRAPIWKSAAVYSCFLGTSANLRYQIIAGLVEYRLGESLVTYYNQPLIAGLLSFVARTLNSYWGTQQWVDLARYTGLQKNEEKPPDEEATTPPELAHLEGGRTEVHSSDDSSKSSDESSLGDSSKSSDESSGPT